MLYIKDYEPPIDPPEEKDVINTCYYCHCETDELTKYKGVWACADCVMDLELEDY